MAHATEKSRLIDILDKLVDNPGDTKDEETSSSDSDSTGKNGTIIDHITPEPENDSIQVLSPPPTVSQRRKRGPRPKSDVYYVPIIVILTLLQF
jgi:hypothetical protein